MKVLLLSNTLKNLFQFRKELIEKLIENSCDVFILSPSDSEQIQKELNNIGCKIINIKIDRRGTNPIKDISLLIKYFFILKKEKPEIIITYTIKPNLYAGLVARMLKIPYIITITGLGSGFQKEGFLIKCIKKIYKFVLKKSKKVFFQNQSNLDYFLKTGLIKENYQLVNGSGVNLEKFKGEILPKEKNIKIIFVARIMEEKGIEEYLEVATLIKEKYPKIEFQILGSFEEEKYKKIINELEKKDIVRYLGVSSDIMNEVSQVHCIINPSWHEGMSNVLLEAGAMKRFLIASDIPGCKEIIKNEETGFTFEKKNIKELEKKVIKFIEIPEQEYEKYINKSYEHIKDNFDRKIVVEKYWEVMND